MRPKSFKHSEKTKKKISLSNTGKKSSQWKGNKAKYQAIHSWIRRHYGKANKCECVDCNNKSNQYQWALKPGYKYKRDINVFMMLCRSCHKKMDINKYTRKKISEALTKYVGCKIIGCNKKHLAKRYCMTHYNTIYRKIK
jgi:hypothetical protein